MKKYILLLVLIINLVPYLKDGEMKWTTTEAGAQYYTIEMVGTESLCGNIEDSKDIFFSTTPCDKIIFINPCNCPYCSVRYACGDTCKNMACPEKTPIECTYCPCCSWTLDLFGNCLNQNCNCSVTNPNSPNYINPNSNTGSGGGGSSGGNSSTGGGAGSGTGGNNPTLNVTQKISAIVTDAKFKAGIDMRKYGGIFPNVDCSMLQYEHLSKQGYNMPRGNCAVQMNWYKSNQFWSTDYLNMQIGDQAFWLRAVIDGVNYYHTGRVINVNPVLIEAATKNNNKPGSIKNYSTNSDGSMWNQPFVGFGRLVN